MAEGLIVQESWQMVSRILLAAVLSPGICLAQFHFRAFDVPGAYATQPRSINAAGWICGTYTTGPTDPFHAFLRSPDGRITTFDVPGSAFTLATGMNDLGQVVGFWSPDVNASTEHAFIREHDGRLTTFDAPGFTYTAANGINNRGTIVLDLLNEPGPSKAYLREPDGTFKPLEFSGSVRAINDQGTMVGDSGVAYPGATSTIANGINDAGVIVGSWNSGQGYQQITHAFLQKTDGTFDNIEFPHASSTTGNAISNAGWVAGSFTDSRPGVHGYLAEPEVLSTLPGLTTIDVPGAYRTYATGINSRGEICGTYELTSSGPTHSYVRDVAGNITTFDVPDATMTVAMGINDLGQVVGYWSPDLYGNTSHVFVRDSSGAVTSFDAPGTQSNVGTSINDRSEILVNALNQPGPRQLFVRTPDSAFNPVRVPFEGVINTLNSRGEIIGCAYIDVFEKAFVLRPGEDPILFTEPDSTVVTCATGINNGGTIVGYYSTGFRGGEREHGFLRRPDGTFETLDVGDSFSTLAKGINDAGWIVGNYDDLQGQQHGYLMAPRRPGRHPRRQIAAAAQP